MDLPYTYWEAEDGWLVGYLNDYPDHLTQGHDLAELEEMLADIYQIRLEEGSTDYAGFQRYKRKTPLAKPPLLW